MNKGMMIKKAFKVIAQSHGFEYSKPARDIWQYRRNKDGVTETFYIQQHRFETSINLMFESQYYRSTYHEAWQIIPREKKVPENLPAKKNPTNIPFDIPFENNSWWFFENEEDFRAIIDTFVEIVKQYGMDYFASVDHSWEEVFSNENLTILYENHTALHDAFASEYGLKSGDVSDGNIDEWFKAIDSIVEQTKNENEETRVQAMLQIAGFLGEELAQYTGGEWVLFAEAHKVLIENMDCYTDTCYAVMDVVNALWRIGSMRICAEYKYIIHSKLPLSDEEIRKVMDEMSRMADMQISNIG